LNTRGITISELGALLGLDKSTVSLALRDSPKIAAATRKRVQAEARRRDYRPNLAARQLGGSGPEVIALIVPADLGSLSSVLAVQAMQVLAAQSARRGYVLHVMPAVADDARAAAPDASLVWGDVPRAMAERVRQRGRPTVVIDPNHPSWSRGDGRRLRLANRAAASELVEHLAARGARRLLFVRQRDDHLGQAERGDAARAGWQRLHGDGGDEVPLAGLDDARLRAIADGHGAILCANDAAALVVRHRLQRLGLVAPRDVRLAGFDGEPLARMTGLTTAGFDADVLARRAIDALRDEQAALADVPATLHVGETT